MTTALEPDDLTRDRRAADRHDRFGHAVVRLAVTFAPFASIAVGVAVLLGAANERTLALRQDGPALLLVAAGALTLFVRLTSFPRRRDPGN